MACPNVPGKPLVGYDFPQLSNVVEQIASHVSRPETASCRIFWAHFFAHSPNDLLYSRGTPAWFLASRLQVYCAYHAHLCQCPLFFLIAVRVAAGKGCGIGAGAVNSANAYAQYQTSYMTLKSQQYCMPSKAIFAQPHHVALGFKLPPYFAAWMHPGHNANKLMELCCM